LKDDGEKNNSKFDINKLKLLNKSKLSSKLKLFSRLKSFNSTSMDKLRSLKFINNLEYSFKNKNFLENKLKKNTDNNKFDKYDDVDYSDYRDYDVYGYSKYDKSNDNKEHEEHKEHNKHNKHNKRKKSDKSNNKKGYDKKNIDAIQNIKSIRKNFINNHSHSYNDLNNNLNNNSNNNLNNNQNDNLNNINSINNNSINNPNNHNNLDKAKNNKISSDKFNHNYLDEIENINKIKLGKIESGRIKLGKVELERIKSEKNKSKRIKSQRIKSKKNIKDIKQNKYSIRRIKNLFNKSINNLNNIDNTNIKDNINTSDDSISSNNPDNDISSNNINNKIRSINKDNDEPKTIIGAAIFGLIIIVVLFSSYYFLFYQPYQNDLSTAKTNKLNELNSLFNGPLALDSNVLVLTSEIELAKSPEEVKAIDVLRPATISWREYHSKQINKTKDAFDRVMLNYGTNEQGISIGNTEKNLDSSKDYNKDFSMGVNNNGNLKNVIMDVNDASLFITENDANVLSNIVFEKPDTVAVPILIDRLQAGAGLISVGSVVDIYTLSNNSYQIQPNEEDSTKESNISSNDSSNEINNQNSDSTNNNKNSNLIENSPDISGSTVLAIMRSKDSGVIDANYIKSRTLINGNDTNQIENSNSFSTDVEEMIRGSISGGYNEDHFASILNKYGLKLSDYERKSSLGEIDVQYLLLIEVPREDVSHVINNMDNIVLTIPTSNAPNWMINELKQAYSS
jgi:hypothetical protein